MLSLVVVSYVACGLQQSSTLRRFALNDLFCNKQTGFVQNLPEIQVKLALKKLSQTILRYHSSFCLFGVRDEQKFATKQSQRSTELITETKDNMPETQKITREFGQRVKSKQINRNNFLPSKLSLLANLVLCSYVQRRLDDDFFVERNANRC